MAIPKSAIVLLLAAVGFSLLPAFWTPVTGDDPPAARQKEQRDVDRDERPATRQKARDDVDRDHEGANGHDERPRDCCAELRRALRGRDGQALRRFDRGNGQPLNPERIRRRLEILRQVYPGLADQMQRQLDEHGDNPLVRKRLEDRIGRLAPSLDRLERMKREDPKGFALEVADMKLHHRTRQLIMQIRRDGDPNGEAARELKRVVEDHFEVRQRKREYELEKLERRFQKLKADLKARRINRKKVIENRLRELMDAGSGAW